MSRKKVLIAAPIHEVLQNGLEESGYESLYFERISQEQAQEIIGICSGVITSTRLRIDRALLDVAPKLEWIGRMGSGMELIDTAYASAKGIKCFASPEGNRNAVAEHALGMLLGITKKIVSSYDEIKQGKWLREENRGIELYGKKIGIVGFGHTGQAFARKLSVFDMQILVYDKYNNDPFPDYVIRSSLEHILDTADIISFHVPLREDTVHYFNKEFLDSVRNPFFLLNTSRGEVLDTGVVYEGLLSGKIAGAALDVLEGEPLSAMDAAQRNLMQQLICLPQVLITPHIAGYTHEALFKMSEALWIKIVTNQ